ncbi:MAG: hypothetical protein BRC39_11130 [Cyanobacteria bacterium QH_7_48_89]|nr:MAG: hypothetical protein BRC39_11130 [Cyanobacteria bacterium QH_7_48_89]
MWCRSARDVEMGRRGDKDTGREFLRAARYLRSGEWKVRIDTPQPQRAFFGIAHPYLEVIRSQGFLKEGA